MELPAPDSIEWTYVWREDGPIVENFDGKRVRLLVAKVTEYPGTDEDPRVDTQGDVVKADGSKNRSFSYQVSAYGPNGLEAKILAAHQQARAPLPADHITHHDGEEPTDA